MNELIEMGVRVIVKQMEVERVAVAVDQGGTGIRQCKTCKH